MNSKTIPNSVEGLRLQWGKLHDLDRAEAVMKMQQSGKSLRSLAKALGCAESLLRNLLLAARAPLPDRILARKKQISTRELVRRSKAAIKASAERDKETQEEKRTKEVQKWSTAICRWLEEMEFFTSHAVSIIDEARWQMAAADVSGGLPGSKAPKGMSLKEIIQRTQPSDSGYEDSSEVASYAAWLARWSFFAIPDPDLRDAALEDASERTSRGESVLPKSKRTRP